MLRKALISIAALVLLLIIAIPFLSARSYQTEYTTLTSADLPKDVGMLRIVYLSDIHFGNAFDAKRLSSLVSAVNALNPDLVLLGGDYAADSEAAIEFFNNMPRFHVRYAACAVMGEHDRTAPESNLSLLKSAMASAGVTPICNSVESIRIGSGSTIYIAGTDDVTYGTADLAGIASQVSSKDYVIFMSHNPSVISDSLRQNSSDGKRAWFDLGLFGHTLGGKVAFFGKSVMDLGSLPDRYMSGWLQENRIDLLVSRGVGTSGLPIRVFCSPQIHVITVKSNQ